MLEADEHYDVPFFSEAEFINHRNEIAAIGSRGLLFLRKRTLGAYFSEEVIPLSSLRYVEVSTRIKLGALIGGSTLLVIGFAEKESRTGVEKLTKPLDILIAIPPPISYSWMSIGRGRIAS